MVVRSSKHQVILGPTATLRSCLWAMTSLRNRGRSAAYCSKLIRSARASFCMSRTQTISHSQQRHGVSRGRPIAQAAFDLVARHRTIACVKVGAARLHALHDRLADLHGDVAKLPFYAVGAVVTRAALDRLQR